VKNILAFREVYNREQRGVSGFYLMPGFLTTPLGLL
jgi:hypothetical protein